MNFNTTNFPSCCGAQVVHNLTGITLAEARSIKRRKLAQVAITVSSGMFSGQQIAEKNLREAGWRELLTFTNPNTANVLTLWCSKGKKLKDEKS